MESIIIATRSLNRELYYYSDRTIQLPYKHIRLTKTTADGYILKLFSLNYDWVINIDEDAFVTNNEAILSLLHYCNDNEFDICGYPDGGVLSCRHNNPLVMNPFFNIINLRSMRNRLEMINRGQIDDYQQYRVHKSEFEAKAPLQLMKKSYDFNSTLTEPYYPIMLWISQNCNCLYLDADTHKDGLSSIAKDNQGTPFLIHTWYSRGYNHDSVQTNRINNIICEALGTDQLPKMPIGIRVKISIEKLSFLFKKHAKSIILKVVSCCSQ